MINIKLADFGLAKLMEEKFEIKNTYIASLQWAAIELLVEQKCSRSSDVWYSFFFKKQYAKLL